MGPLAVLTLIPKTENRVRRQKAFVCGVQYLFGTLAATATQDVRVHVLFEN